MESWAQYMTAVANITDKGFVTSAIVNKEIKIKDGINSYVCIAVQSVLYCDGQMNWWIKSECNGESHFTKVTEKMYITLM